MSRVASASRGVGTLAAVLFFGTPLAIQIDLLGSGIGFRIFMLGGLLGLIALILGGIGLLRTRESSGREGRGRAILGTVLGVVILATVFAAAGPTADVPPINDITTDTQDPPAFVAAAKLAANADRDMAYPGESFASQQKAGYPDLASVTLPDPPAVVLERVAGLIKKWRWQLVDRDDASGRIEATDTTRIFRFVDDLVVRVRPEGTGSVVDVRSKSRDGRSDLGANATRIRRLLYGLDG